MFRSQFKLFKLAFFALIFTLFANNAFALHAVVPDVITQGSTLEILVPKHDIVFIEGNFNGRNLTFYEILSEPKWDEAITRGEFLKLLFDNYDFEDATAHIAAGDFEFPDVSEDNPYYDYIKKAAKLDIIHGYEDGFFRPYTPITRAHIAKILVNAFDPPCNDNHFVKFPDVTQEDWHYEFIHHASCVGYFQGYPDGLMRPNRDINYLEAEIVVKRSANPNEYKSADKKTYYRAFSGLHRTNDHGTKTLTINAERSNGESADLRKQVEVLERDYRVVSFTLPETKTKLFGQQEQDTTWQMINEAKADPLPDQLWEGAFIIPTQGTVTLGFGDKLYINGNYSGSHFGIDYANNEGTPIYASNTGVVTLSDETMSYGNTIIIDHGQNVFTMYLHMSELTVIKGDHVEKGDLIGYMGSTGIATGPHLHFNHFIGDVIVDSAEWY